MRFGPETDIERPVAKTVLHFELGLRPNSARLDYLEPRRAAESEVVESIGFCLADVSGSWRTLWIGIFVMTDECLPGLVARALEACS